MSNTVFLIGAIIISGYSSWRGTCLLLLVGIVADIVSKLPIKFVVRR
jgi:hypothetical protein